MKATKIIEALEFLAIPENVPLLNKYFKTGKGEYGEGDNFLGVKVPEQRKVAKKFQNTPLSEVKKLLHSKIHEYRLTALFILLLQYKKKPEQREKIKKLYLDSMEYINNWDLVDSSAHKILGDYLLDKDRKILYDLANTKHLWKQRIAIMSSLAFINNNDFEDTLKLAKILLKHPHDLIHKAVGWMLREVGNKNKEVEIEFLDLHYKEMPRTMLRYAIEKFPEDERQQYLKGTR